MYIISKNKDYYDGVADSMGIDKTIVYERHPIEITKQKDMPKIFHHKNIWQHRYDNPFYNITYSDVNLKKTKKYKKAYCFIIGFCGKLYLGWKLHYTIKRYGFALDEEKIDIVHGYKNAKKYLKNEYWRHNLDDDIKYIETYDPINIFREINAPVFVYDTDTNNRHNSFIINPLLKDYEFYRVIDTFQTFQEIQMFIGGVLGSGEKDIIEVDDKYKITQHGFNKWSFRKEPTKKK